MKAENIITEKPKAKIGIIGCGARVRGLFPLCEDYSIEGIFDPSPEAIAAAREVYGAHVRNYESVDSLVNDPEITWVVVGSWNVQHAEQVIAALRGGKHVFCEKPLATNLKDCLAVRDAVEASGCMFFFGLVLRFSPFYQKIHELLQGGEIGRLISFEFNETLNFYHGAYIMGNWRRFRENAGTHLLEKCCHDMDIAQWLTGSLPRRVASFGGLNFFTPEMGATRRNKEKTERPHPVWQGGEQADPFTSEKDIVDNQVVILEYANGVRASFHTNCATGIPERRIYLIGSEGAIRADALTGKIELRRMGADAPTQHFDTNVDGGHPGGHAGGDAVLEASFRRSMLHGEPPLVGVDAALRAAVVSFAIDEALDTGTIVDLEAVWKSAGIQ